jgi:hypothetical protein
MEVASVLSGANGFEWHPNRMGNDGDAMTNKEKVLYAKIVIGLMFFLLLLAAILGGDPHAGNVPSLLIGG